MNPEFAVADSFFILVTLLRVAMGLSLPSYNIRIRSGALIVLATWLLGVPMKTKQPSATASSGLLRILLLMLVHCQVFTQYLSRAIINFVHDRGHFFRRLGRDVIAFGGSVHFFDLFFSRNSLGTRMEALLFTTHLLTNSPHGLSDSSRLHFKLGPVSELK